MLKLAVALATVAMIGFAPRTGISDTGHGQAEAEAVDGGVRAKVEDWTSSVGNIGLSSGGADMSSVSEVPPTFTCAELGLAEGCVIGVVEATGPGAGGQQVLPARMAATELRHFAPAATGFTIEPDGWAIVGSHTNAYATATTQTSNAVILGVPVTVTFEPAEYRWDWGDGTASTTTTGGASWSALRLENWSRTATSHVFTERGQRTVTLSVAYRATVLAHGRTIPVEGLVVGAPHAAPVLVVESQRALVVHDCLEAPNDPGC